jgi:hypothetical protein
VSKLPSYNGVNVYSIFQFLNKALADKLSIYSCDFGLAINILVIAKAFEPSFDVAIALTVKLPTS